MTSKKNLPVVDWLQIESSAPGKFIISGEYSVVYEKQAIAAAIDLRTRVTIRPNKEGLIRLRLKNLKSELAWPTTALASHRLVSKNSSLEFTDTMPTQLGHLLSAKYCTNSDDCRAASTSSGATSSDGGDRSKEQSGGGTDGLATNEKKELNKKAQDAAMAFLLLYLGIGDSFCNSARLPIDVEVDSEVPVGSGLGSSSAYSVALCGALMKVFLASVEKYIISNWAFNIDKYFHGKPSGVDNNVVAFGGYILFQHGKIKSHGVPHNLPIKVMLIDTGVSRSTKALSERVITQLRDDPGTVNSLFSTINEMTTQIWRKINDHDFTPRQITSQLSANQLYLNRLGVGHEKLADICAKAEECGLTAKQTGAGGGGTAFVLYDDSENCPKVARLREILRSSGYTVHDHLIGCDGLTVKLTPDPEKRFQLCDN